MLAVGAAVIAVLAVGNLRLTSQIPPIFQDALLDVPGEKAVQIPEQDAVGDQIHQHPDDGANRAEPGEDQGHQIEGNCSNQQKNIQLTEFGWIWNRLEKKNVRVE